MRSTGTSTARNTMRAVRPSSSSRMAGTTPFMFRRTRRSTVRPRTRTRKRITATIDHPRMRLRPESIGDYHAVFAMVLSCAPDHFKPIGGEKVDQPQALRDAFDDLREKFRFAKKRIK